MVQSWVLFALLSAVFAAATSILAKIGIKGVDSNLATAIRTVVITAFAWGIVIVQGTVKQLGGLNKTTWIFLILSGVPIDKLSLVLAVIMAVVFLHEKLTWPTAIGSVMITIGVLVIAMWK